MMAERRPASLGPLLMTIAVVAIASMAMRPSVIERGKASATSSVPIMNLIMEGNGGPQLRVRSTSGGELLLAMRAHGPLRACGASDTVLSVRPDHRTAQRLWMTPTSVQWRAPLTGLPVAAILRAAERDPHGMVGPERFHTVVYADHGALPIVSLILPEGAFFDPDTGSYVVGHAMIHPPGNSLEIYARDLKWWKYPGNFHGRGMSWERAAQVQVLGSQGEELFQVPCGVRIHGNMTRGLPQHAMRLHLRKPLEVPLAGTEGQGIHTLMLRAAGNDAPKAFMRDAVMNEICAELSIEVSRATPVVVYINGAYWGLHHLRPRLDEKEIARRHGLEAKDVRIIELEMPRMEGEEDALKAFREDVLALLEKPGEVGFAKALDESLDVDGFLTYMAACMIGGLRDWPRRNVKIWRNMGRPVPGTMADGRWRFLMADADLAMGAVSDAGASMYVELDRPGFPVPDLFRALMEDPDARSRFRSRLNELLVGTFDPSRMLAVIDRFALGMDAEMVYHTARWRKPIDRDTWRTEVDRLRRFARERPAGVRSQLASRP